MSMEAESSTSASRRDGSKPRRSKSGSGKGKGKATKQDEQPEQQAEEPSYIPPQAKVNKYIRGDAVNTATRNKKLATHLTSLSNAQRQSAVAAYEHDSLLLPQSSSSRIQAETDLERTWKVSQSDIAENVGVGAASKGFELRLDEFGPYEMDYTSDGRHLAIAGRKGHVATFDWQTGKLGTEMHLKETVRDISWLHNTSFFAVAQKKYVYIYDNNGLEIHQMRNHIEVNRMEFLRYHFLLATVGNAGYLKYQDTSTGQIVSEHRTRLGSCSVMAQNPHSAVLSLGHSNGTCTLWTPNIATAQVKLLAHNGPVSSISHDPSSLGCYFSTTGLDGSLKVWDSRMWKSVNEWRLKRPGQSTSWSQKGLLAVGWGNHTTIYADPTSTPNGRAPGPYMTQLFPSTPVHSLAFCPFEDILGVGHSTGFTSLIIPGSGEANYDSLEADPYSSKKARREKEVISLLDKIQPDQIHLDTEFIGKFIKEKQKARDPLAGLSEELKRVSGPNGVGKKQAKDFYQLSRLERLRATGQEDLAAEDEATAAAAEEEDYEEVTNADGTKSKKPKKARGKNKMLKRLMRRKANIIDAKTAKVKELRDERRKAALEKRAKVESRKDNDESGALARFK